jgi:hypothetical protein
MSVHTRRPCVCVYRRRETVPADESGNDETARGRRVYALAHTLNTLCCVLLLFCLQHKLHTHVTTQEHVCVQSVGTDSEVSHVPS